MGCFLLAQKTPAIQEIKLDLLQRLLEGSLPSRFPFLDILPAAGISYIWQEFFLKKNKSSAIPYIHLPCLNHCVVLIS